MESKSEAQSSKLKRMTKPQDPMRDGAGVAFLKLNVGAWSFF
jgi:hypothetical protein